MTTKPSVSRRNYESGFTLIEACIATLVLSFGIMGIANLSVIATTNNSSGHRSTVAAFLASQKLEELKATPYETLSDSAADSLDVDQTNYNAIIAVPGAGRYRLALRVSSVGSTVPPMKHLVARAEGIGGLSRTTRAEFATFRTCSLGPTAGCP